MLHRDAYFKRKFKTKLQQQQKYLYKLDIVKYEFRVDN